MSFSSLPPSPTQPQPPADEGRNTFDIRSGLTPPTMAQQSPPRSNAPEAGDSPRRGSTGMRKTPSPRPQIHNPNASPPSDPPDTGGAMPVTPNTFPDAPAPAMVNTSFTETYKTEGGTPQTPSEHCAVTFTTDTHGRRQVLPKGVARQPPREDREASTPLVETDPRPRGSSRRSSFRIDVYGQGVGNNPGSRRSSFHNSGRVSPSVARKRKIMQGSLGTPTAPLAPPVHGASSRLHPTISFSRALTTIADNEMDGAMHDAGLEGMPHGDSTWFFPALVETDSSSSGSSISSCSASPTTSEGSLQQEVTLQGGAVADQSTFMPAVANDSVSSGGALGSFTGRTAAARHRRGDKAEHGAIELESRRPVESPAVASAASPGQTASQTSLVHHQRPRHGSHRHHHHHHHHHPHESRCLYFTSDKLLNLRFCHHHFHIDVLSTGIHLFILVLTLVSLWLVFEEEMELGGAVFAPLSTVLFATLVGGYVTRLLHMPALIGIIICGIIWGNIPAGNGKVLADGMPETYIYVVRKVAVAAILTRAGLTFRWKVMRPLAVNVGMMAVVPQLVEGIVQGITAYYFFNYTDPLFAAYHGAANAAVSAAVVVPVAAALQAKGFNVHRGPVILMMCACGADNVYAVWITNFLYGMIFDKGSFPLWLNVLLAPVQIVVGILLGIVVGKFLVKLFNTLYDRLALLEVPEKINAASAQHHQLVLIIVIAQGIFVMLLSEKLHFPGLGTVAIMATAASMSHSWLSSEEQAHAERRQHLAAHAASLWDSLVAPCLFSLVGSGIRLGDVMTGEFLGPGLGSLAIGLFVKSLVVVSMSLGTDFSRKEVVFLVFGWYAKATIQAAVGGKVLTEAQKRLSANDKAIASITNTTIRTLMMASPERAQLQQEVEWGKIINNETVISIVLCSVGAAIFMMFAGPHLLTKDEPHHHHHHHSKNRSKNHSARRSATGAHATATDTSTPGNGSIVSNTATPLTPFNPSTSQGGSPTGKPQGCAANTGGGGGFPVTAPGPTANSTGPSASPPLVARPAAKAQETIDMPRPGSENVKANGNRV